MVRCFGPSHTWLVLHIFIFVQEHWLLKSLLWKFDLVHKDFVFEGCSAMDNVCSQGLLLGRPFGGVGILYRRHLAMKLRVVACHSEGRCIAVTIDHGNLRLLCFGVYLPCDDGSQHYHNCMSEVLGFIESIIELYPDYKCVLLGDFNFECVSSSSGYRDFIPLMNEMNLTVCDAMDSNCVGYTYSHNTLSHRSLIDHVFVHNDVVPLISEYKVLLDATNCSDHLPIQFCLSVEGNSSLSVNGSSSCLNSLSGRTVCDYRMGQGEPAWVLF